MVNQTKNVFSLVISLLLAGATVVSTAYAGQAGLRRIEQPAALVQLKLSAFASSCKQDGEIPAEKLAAIDNRALLFVHAALGPHPAHAFQSYATTRLQKEVSATQFGQFMRRVDHFAPFDPVGVTHTYWANVVGQPQGAWVKCGTLSEPRNLVSFRTMPSVKQAWVLVNGKARNNTWTFTIWLVWSGGGWRVDSFTANASTLANLSAEDVWRLARSEEARHHWLNAFILYNMAIQLAWRGPSFRLGIVQAIRRQMEKIHVPSSLQGKPPFAWSFGAHTFKVLNVGPIAVAGKIYLDIAYDARPWKNYKQVDQENRELIRDFASKYPEYSAVFAGIIGEAHEIGGNQGFRTVEVLRNGSLVPVR